MPTQNVTAGLQGRVTKQANSVTNWLSQVRNSSTGTGANTYSSATLESNAFRASYTSGRVGNSGVVFRTFLFFDVSSVPGTIDSATLQIYGTTQGTSDAFIVESTAWGGNGSSTSMTTSMYDDLDFSQPYSQSSISTWSISTSSPNQFTINSAGLSDMNTNGYLNVALINKSYDYDGLSPLIGTSVASGVRFKNTTYPIRLVIDYTEGYDNDVAGVVNTKIDEVIARASNKIQNVIGTPVSPP